MFLSRRSAGSRSPNDTVNLAVVGIASRGRASIGRVQESSLPAGVHWDIYLGPAPCRAFSLNRLHYGWRLFWDTSTTEIGNNGVHYLDLVRWGLRKKVHPVKIVCFGGSYVEQSSLHCRHVRGQ